MEELRASMSSIATDVRWLRERAEEDRKDTKHLLEALDKRLDAIEHGRTKERAWAAGAGAVAAFAITIIKSLMSVVGLTAFVNWK